MRAWVIALAWLASAASAAAQSAVTDVDASPPVKLSVTVYRAPWRNGGGINIDNANGFALVSETRQVVLPPGEARLRFQGVVDGIEPASAIVTGLPGGVIEKNRDAALLSPEALVRAALGRQVWIRRTDRKTGKVTETPAEILSANDGGVTLKTADGVEALRCSGAPETFSLGRVPQGLSSSPTLSVMTRTDRPVTATVTLSYLAEGFDWAADYTARINPDGRTLDLGGWITLVNASSVSLPGAATQIVAGRLSHTPDPEAQQAVLGSAGSAPPSEEALDRLRRAIAQCWPQGSTADNVSAEDIGSFPNGDARFALARAPAPAPEMIVVTGMRGSPEAEQLGDLKLYRIAEPTTVAARQAKQVRLMDRRHVPFTRLAQADLDAAGEDDSMPVRLLLRLKNKTSDGLGLPLPAGSIAVLGDGGGQDLLLGQARVRDTAVGQDVELRFSTAPDIQVRQTQLRYDAAAPRMADLTPELRLVMAQGQAVEEVVITNARPTATPFELRLRLDDGARIVSPDHPMTMKDGRPLFSLTLPPNGTVRVRYLVRED